jgi:hypothetical protein
MGLKDIFKGIFKPASEFREPTHCTSVAREMNSAMENIEGYSIRYHYEDVNVCVWDGIIPKGTEVGNRIVFIQEKDNDYDPNAILLLLVPQKRKLGYLYRGKLQDMVNDYLNRGDKVTARVSKITSKPIQKVLIDMVFHVKVNKKK